VPIYVRSACSSVGDLSEPLGYLLGRARAFYATAARRWAWTYSRTR